MHHQTSRHVDFRPDHCIIKSYNDLSENNTNTGGYYTQEVRKLPVNHKFERFDVQMEKMANKFKMLEYYHDFAIMVSNCPIILE